MANRILGILGFGVLMASACVPAFAGVVPPAPTPEPATLALLGTGIAAIAGVGYLRSRKK